jgi:hypothetical protein
MDNLFSPCTRLHDILESQRRFERRQLLQELNLDVSTEDFLSAENAFTYADLYAMLENYNTLAWLTPHAAVARVDGLAVQAWNQLDESYRLSFSADGKFICAFARSPEHLSEVFNVVVQLLAASVVHLVRLSTNAFYSASINTTSLAYLMEQCQSLKSLTLSHIALNEDHIRALGAYSRPGLEMVLDHCRITITGASALAEVLGRNQGPTKLDWCNIDNLVLSNGMRGNSHLKSLRPRFSCDLEVRYREFLALTGARRENKGLTELNLACYGIMVSDETWGAVCDSFKTHPTLEVLDIRTTVEIGILAPAVLKSRIQALLDMVKVNMSIHTIRLDPLYNQHELFRESVIPYLETNRSRPRLFAIQRTRPIMYRAKILGQALFAVRSDPNRFWMFLSGNAEVAFPPITGAMTTPAANLPTPATASATANVAAPSADRKRSLVGTLAIRNPTSK